MTPNDEYVADAGERVVRHRNGHLMIERTPEWVPTKDEQDAALRSLGKAWPVVADHASHIDGEFSNALDSVRRMLDAFAARLAAPAMHPDTQGYIDALEGKLAASEATTRLARAVADEYERHFSEADAAREAAERERDDAARIAVEMLVEGLHNGGKLDDLSPVQIARAAVVEARRRTVQSRAAGTPPTTEPDRT